MEVLCAHLGDPGRELACHVGAWGVPYKYNRTRHKKIGRITVKGRLGEKITMKGGYI